MMETRLGDNKGDDDGGGGGDDDDDDDDDNDDDVDNKGEILLIVFNCVDISKNRFVEIPEVICDYVSIERLNCYHNVIKCLPRAIVQLQSLVYLNLR